MRIVISVLLNKNQKNYKIKMYNNNPRLNKMLLDHAHEMHMGVKTSKI